MASAYVEYGVRALPVPAGSQVPQGNTLHGRCAAAEVLAISASKATGAIVGSATANYARVTTDALCWVAVGTAPDTTATAATAASGARRILLANTTIELGLAVGQKVAVQSAP